MQTTQQKSQSLRDMPVTAPIFATALLVFLALYFLIARRDVKRARKKHEAREKKKRAG